MWTVGLAFRRSTACAVVVFFAQPSAHAETHQAASAQADTARAEALFREGRDLFAAGRLGEACRKFEESQSLEPSPGTLLNLGACHRERGDFLRSMADFRRAAELASTHADEARKAAWTEAARKELQALEPRIPSLKWKASATKPASVFVDGAEQPWPLPAGGTQVNPGAHRIEIRAPDHEPVSLDVRVVEGQVLEVVIPELVPTSRANEKGAPNSASAASSPNVAPYVAFGISGLLLGTGVVTGLLARSAESDLEEQCTEPDPAQSGRFLCDPSLESTRDRARTLGVVTDVLWAGALVGAGVGVFLLLNEPGDETAKVGRKAPPRTTAKLGVDAGCGRAGCSVSLAGKF